MRISRYTHSHDGRMRSVDFPSSPGPTCTMWRSDGTECTVAFKLEERQHMRHFHFSLTRREAQILFDGLQDFLEDVVTPKDAKARPLTINEPRTERRTPGYRGYRK